MSWLAQDFPFSGGIVTAGAQRGVWANVPADGTASPQVFPVAFAGVPVSLEATILGTALYELSVQVDPASITDSGCTVYVTGGPPGSTASVSWLAVP